MIDFNNRSFPILSYSQFTSILILLIQSIWNYIIEHPEKQKVQILYNLMGHNSTKIIINQNITYEGQVDNGVPDGKGLVSIYDNANHKQRTKIWNIEGQFSKGELINCSATKNDLIYVGPVKSGTFSGHANIVNKTKNIQFVGNIQDGILIDGAVKKQNAYSFKGQFKIQIQNTKSSVVENQTTEYYLLDGENVEYHSISLKQKIKGKFQFGELNGLGTYQFQNGDRYHGTFKNGYIEGEGKYTSINSEFISIIGQFNKSKPNSDSLSRNKQNHRIQFTNGDVYEGPMKQGQMHGMEGLYSFANGTVYKGAFYQNTFTGDCQISYGQNFHIESYKGEVHAGLFNGLGVVQYKNGVILKGYFLNNCKNGPCIYIYGSRMFKCLYIMDELMGEITEVPVHKL